jgi:hypothetical protein
VAESKTWYAWRENKCGVEEAAFLVYKTDDFYRIMTHSGKLESDGRGMPFLFTRQSLRNTMADGRGMMLSFLPNFAESYRIFLSDCVAPSVANIIFRTDL